MSDQPTLEEFAQALEELPPEFKSQLATVVQPQSALDSVTIKFDLIKFVTELQKHNQGVDWETNKIKPKSIRIEKVIEEATELFNFLTE